ncbi:hypothetical protein JL2886_03254 [Phaeobacter gallaeciensis]|uniref:Uncharacterized protein n=1 Tax=Phaeobacter gallaeciensis TaxID=60890 RepID=A0A1B0ZVL8_9RHOB|nr:hypothetical protein JL2886_03254 [Phaeobacter gallaeciensis]
MRWRTFWPCFCQRYIRHPMGASTPVARIFTSKRAYCRKPALACSSASSGLVRPFRRGRSAMPFTPACLVMLVRAMTDYR